MSAVPSQVWWYMSVIPALGRLRQEDHEFSVSLDYIVRPGLKNQKKKVSFSHLVPQIKHNPSQYLTKLFCG
jgi:hypothetical protein